MSRKAFPEKMKSRGFGEGSDGRVRYWTGLRLRTTDTTDTIGGCFQVSSKEQLPIERNQKEGQIASVASAGAANSVLPQFPSFVAVAVKPSP